MTDATKVGNATWGSAAAPRLIAAARWIAALSVVLWLLPTAAPVRAFGPALLAALCAVAALLLALSAGQSRGTMRSLLGAVSAGTGIATIGCAAWAIRALTHRGGPILPSSNGAALALTAAGCLAAGLAIALGRWRHRNWMRIEAIADALLMVAATAIVVVQLSSGRTIAPAATRALQSLTDARNVVDAGILILLALLLAWRGEALGERVAGWLALGTLAVVFGDVLYTRALLTGQPIPTWSAILWTVGVVAYVGLVRPSVTSAAELSGESPKYRHHAARVRLTSIVIAILIAGLTAAPAAAVGEESVPLAAAIAIFGVLVAARTGAALWMQQRAAAALEERVAAERELSATLEQRVQARTAELADAQRALQRMWALGQQIALELRSEGVLHRYLEAVIDVVRADGGAVALHGEDGRPHVVCTAGAAPPAEEALRALSTTMERVLLSGVVWHVAAMRAGEERDLSAALAALEIRGGAILPVQRRGERVGTVLVTTRASRTLSTQDVANVEAMTDLLSVALANADLLETMRKAEWRFRTLFRVAPDAVFTVLESGRVREANEAVRDVLGIAPVQAVGRTIDEFVLPDDRERVRGDLHRALAGAAVRSEVRFHNPSGPRTVSLAARALPEAEPPTVLFVGRDVTVEREMRVRLAESERLAAVGELVAGVAHEVNNPLSTISAFAQLLLRDEPLSPPLRESLEVIRSETQRASQVLRDLLTFARRSEHQPELLVLNDLVERTARLRAYDMDLQRISCQLELDPELPPVTGDARQLQQVVLNLVTNAIQAMGEGGGSLTLVTRGERDRVVLEVRDTGPGIVPEARAHIFEPFFTTKRDGTGLGLSVSYGIVAAHMGAITVVDTGPSGTTFRVTLPTPDEATLDAAAETSPALPAPSPLAGLRLLFIDDEPSLRSGVQRYGRLRRFDVVTADDGAMALDAARHGTFDAVVCDLRMPVMDGPAFFEVLRREHPKLAARTLFITGDLVNSASRSFLDAATQPVLSKPFELEQLEESLTALLHGEQRRP